MILRDSKVLLLYVGFIILSMGYLYSNPAWEAKVDAATRAKADSTLGRLYYERHLEILYSQPADAIQCLKKSALHYQKSRMEIHKAGALSSIGQIYNTMGISQLALEYLFQAYDIIAKRNDDSSLSWLLSDIGNVYFAMNQFDIAQTYYERGRDLMQKLDNKYGESVMLNNLAMCNMNRGKDQAALNLFKKSMRLRIQIENNFAIYHSMNYVAIMYSKLGDKEKALDYQFQIYNALKEPVEPIGASMQLRGQSAMAISALYSEKGDRKLADFYLDRSIEIFEELGDLQNLNSALTSKAHRLYSEGHNSAAIDIFRRIFNTSRQSGMMEQAKDSAQNLTHIYLKNQNTQMATEFFQYYSNYADSLYAMRSPESLVQLHSVIQNHLKDMENMELKSRHRIMLSFLVISLVLFVFAMISYLRYVFANRKHLLRLKQLADASFEAIMIHDNGLIIDVNDRFPEMLSIPREACLGKDFESLVKTKIDPDIVRKIETGSITNYELQILDGKNRLLDVEIMSRPYIYGKKELRVAAIRNITEKKHFIRSIIETQSQLKALNATKDKLLSIIAHDLRNPFNAIIGFSDLMRRDLKRFSVAQIAEMIDLIFESSHTAYSLLQNLLEWARVQTGSIPMNPESIPLKAFFDALIPLEKPALSNKKQKLHLNCADDITVFADPKMLHTITHNLLTNAIKFTPQGGSIDIDVSSIGGCTIKICDSGIGMDKDQLSKLFKTDSIASRTGTENESGTGLGLVLCHDLMLLHKGSIKAESEENRGTCFTLYFPNTITKE